MSSFVESQRFRQPWIWGILLICAVLVLGPLAQAVYEQFVMHHPAGNRPMPDRGLISTTLFTIALFAGLIGLFAACELRVEVGDDALSVRFRPFLHRSIPFTEIASAEARTYSPLLEYGGWGIRFGRKGTAYNVSGNRGVQLRLANGQRLLLGSQRADELAAAIEERRNAGSR